jgi:hypothetical protein
MEKVLSVILIFVLTGLISTQPNSMKNQSFLSDSSAKKTLLIKAHLYFGQTGFDYGQVPRNAMFTHVSKYNFSAADNAKIIRSVFFPRIFRLRMAGTFPI